MFVLDFVLRDEHIKVCSLGWVYNCTPN